MPLASCEQPSGPGGATVPQGSVERAVVEQVTSTLISYFRAINNGDFTTAFAQRADPNENFESFRDAVRSSQDSDFKVMDLRRDGDEVVVWLTFTSKQEAGRGPRERPDETCTRWSLDYRFTPVGGLWLISGTSAHPGAPPNTPCQ